jgi:O-antigen ligase
MKAGFRERIPYVNSWLLTALFFMIPIQVAPAYILSALMLVLWLIEGRFREKLGILRAEPMAWIFAAYYGVFLLSLLWTADMAWGWRMVNKQNFFLLFLLYFTVARREHVARYLTAFLLSIAMCEMLAYYNWVDLHLWPQLPDGVRADKGVLDTAPFVDRIMYAPALALAAYVAGHRVLFGGVGKTARWACALLWVTTVGNLLISGGRAGVVGFLVMVAVLAFQKFSRRPLLAVMAAAVVVGGIVVGGYHSSDYFRLRVNDAVDQVQHYEERPNSSVGLRITYAMNAWRIFSANPLLGVGAGDYPVEYQLVNAIHTPQWTPAWNPHNQYLLALTSAGILGGLALAMVLLFPMARAWRSPDDWRHPLRIALPMLLLTICLFESYLMRSNISMMYVLFTAALWCGGAKTNAET